MLAEKKIRKAIKVLDGWVKEEYIGRDVQVVTNWISIDDFVEAVTVEMRIAAVNENIATGIHVFINDGTLNKLSVKQLAAYFLASVHAATSD